jgi:hypothetical protein
VLATQRYLIGRYLLLLGAEVGMTEMRGIHHDLDACSVAAFTPVWVGFEGGQFPRRSSLQTKAD